MKKKIALMLMIASLFVSCTEGAFIEKNGEQVWVKSYGLNGKPEKGIEYEVNAMNAVVSIFCLETVLVPVVYVLDYIYVPVGVINEKND